MPKVVQTLRDYLIAAGVEFAFDTRVDDFVFDGKTVKGVQLRDGREVGADAVVLATGHSARDIYELCSRRGIHLESKPYAMGVRIEHPQAMIDEIQYGGLAAHPQLGAAPYSLKQTVDGIGVYSFCMCPGGFIVPAATQSGQLVVNGMSPSKRNSKFANSGFVVTVDEAVYGDSVLDGLTYQAEVEKAAYAAGGGAKGTCPESRRFCGGPSLRQSARMQLSARFGLIRPWQGFARAYRRTNALGAQIFR